MGAQVDGRLERYGFMPAGGGRVVIDVTPGGPRRFEALDRGKIADRLAEAYFANLPVQVAERELKDSWRAAWPAGGGAQAARGEVVWPRQRGW